MVFQTSNALIFSALLTCNTPYIIEMNVHNYQYNVLQREMSLDAVCFLLVRLSSRRSF